MSVTVLTDEQRELAIAALDLFGYDPDMIAAEWDDHDIKTCMEAHGYTWQDGAWVDADGRFPDQAGSWDACAICGKVPGSKPLACDRCRRPVCDQCAVQLWDGHFCPECAEWVRIDPDTGEMQQAQT